MTNILLDVTRLLSRLHDGLHPTGVDRVGLAYIKRYAPKATAVLSERGYFTVLQKNDSEQIFDLLLSSICNRAAIRRITLRALFNHLRGRKRFHDSVLLHTSHNGMEFGRYYGGMSARGVRTVFMVHDLIPITHAEYCRPGVDTVHRKRIHTALKHADGLITNSQSTLDSLSAEARHADLPLPPSTVALLASGIDARSAYVTPPPDQAPYFVMLSTIEPRKNHWFILHVWRRLTEQLGAATPKLVIIGRRGWECENVVDMLERCTALRDTVIELPSCSDEDLRAWLQHARALLFPSFVEGYGMPLVEALALGVPVLASNLDVFSEISGDIPEYIDPLDGLDWIKQIIAYSQPNSSARQAQLERMVQFREPSWADHFERVDDLIDRLRTK
ncbi:glycosyltransferase family 4 protein [Burkholderia lata]|uniref:glycosyltransferase family 4 protein n=1 Tax=Burkholderia lata (strain ATCC 17760 / DSM 23089 / LMG 22485 / NCIMB 9086 / R18194 / 383) TaxID=482957 RepID=UPI0015833CEB|nr:glycosyltransferase family 1 protein [Burkholderia lata]